MPNNHTQKFIKLIDADDLEGVLGYILPDQLWMKIFFRLYYERYIYPAGSVYKQQFDDLEPRRLRQVELFHKILPRVDLNLRTESWPYMFMYVMIEHCYDFMMAIVKDPRHDCRVMDNQNNYGDNLLDYLMCHSFWPGKERIETVISFLMKESRVRIRITPKNCFTAAMLNINIELLQEMLTVCNWSWRYNKYDFRHNYMLANLVRCASNRDHQHHRKTTLQHALLIVYYAKQFWEFNELLNGMQKDSYAMEGLEKYEILALVINAPLVR